MSPIFTGSKIGFSRNPITPFGLTSPTTIYTFDNTDVATIGSFGTLSVSGTYTATSSTGANASNTYLRSNAVYFTYSAPSVITVEQTLYVTGNLRGSTASYVDAGWAMGISNSLGSTTGVIAAAVQLCSNGIIFWVNGLESHTLSKTINLNDPIAIRIEKNGTSYTARYAFSDGTTSKTTTSTSATAASYLSFGGYGPVYSSVTGYWGQSAAKNTASIDDPMQLINKRFINYI
jgi:hypothetical protein